MSNYNNDRLIELESRLAAAERERDEIMAMAERREGELQARLFEAVALLRHLREEWLETDDYAPEYRDKFNALLDRIDAFLAGEKND